LIAFIPLFTLVLAICQLAFIASAKAVVEHSAWAAARSAVVVLEDDPHRYGDIPRGDHLSHTSQHVPGITEVMAILNIDTGDLGQAVNWAADGAEGDGVSHVENDSWIGTQTAKLSDMIGVIETLPSRMTPIRAAAYLPLLPLANTDLGNKNESVRRAISDQFFFRMQAALQYTRAAAAVTLHYEPEDDAVAGAPFPPNADVTARVIYLYSCDVPVVRQFMCRSLDSILSTGNRLAVSALDEAQDASMRATLFPLHGRYSLLIGKATLVSQGAGYEDREGAKR
jgi:hypothetical protein